MGTCLSLACSTAVTQDELQVPIIFHPLSLASDKNPSMSSTENTGMSSIAPELALLTVGDRGQLEITLCEYMTQKRD